MESNNKIFFDNPSSKQNNNLFTQWTIKLNCNFKLALVTTTNKSSTTILGKIPKTYQPLGSSSSKNQSMEAAMINDCWNLKQYSRSNFSHEFSSNILTLQTKGITRSFTNLQNHWINIIPLQFHSLKQDNNNNTLALIWVDSSDVPNLTTFTVNEISVCNIILLLHKKTVAGQ